MMKKTTSLFFLFLAIWVFDPIEAHHFKGLPHYGYFENYPQTPIEEYLGQSKRYEFFLVLYDFQGLRRESVEQPDDVKFFLNVYDLVADKAYSGPLKLEILDGERVLDSVIFKSAEQESLYYYNHKLSDDGDFALRVNIIDLKLPEEETLRLQKTEELKNNNLPVTNRLSQDVAQKSQVHILETGVIKFETSAQKISWGKWLSLALLVLVAIAAVGARRKRILDDRKAAAKHKEA